MKNTQRIVLVAAGAAVAASGAFWCYVSYRVGRYPDNHVGWDPQWGLLICGALALCAVVGLRTDRRRVLWIGLLVWSAVSGGLLIAIDHHNVLVSYEKWLARRMPPRPF